MFRPWLAAIVVAFAGCAAVSPGSLKPGTPTAQIQAQLGAPIATHPLPGGGQRLEYRGNGPFTYMLDVDAGGRLVASTQVLTPATFGTITAGMSADQVRATLGQPSEIMSVGWSGAQVWSYHYQNPQCLWFQLQFGADGHTTGSGSQTQFPACIGGP